MIEPEVLKCLFQGVFSLQKYANNVHELLWHIILENEIIFIIFHCDVRKK